MVSSISILRSPVSRPRGWRRSIALLILTASLAADDAAARELAPRFVAWLEEVAPLMHAVERELFDSLREDYERDAFIRSFWRERDPYPQTGRNELRERYFENLNRARERFSSLDDARARFLVVHGEPASVLEVRCTTTRSPAALWVYRGSLQGRLDFVVLFLSDRNGAAPARVWRATRPGAIDGLLRNMRECMNGELLADVVEQLREQGQEYDARLDRALAKPRPRTLEWVANFSANSAMVPDGASRLRAQESVRFGGRDQSRTTSEWTILVNPEDAGVESGSGLTLHAFEVVGEVIRDDDLLETFRYLFRIPAERPAPSVIPITFERLLRPGSYRVRMRLRDLVGDRYWSSDGRVEVPASSEPVSSAAGVVLGRPSERIAEGLRSSLPSIRIVEPDGLQRGAVRFDTLISGEQIERVRFVLDQKPVVTKTRAPYSVELDLGSFPEQRELRVEALDADGQVVATDEMVLNAGGDRFAIHLIRPTGSEASAGAVVAEARVVAPRATKVDRVDFFVDETLAVSLFQAPWRARLPAGTERKRFVRVEGRLADGRVAEDVVLLNGEGAVGAELDVQLVELFVSARDRQGRALPGLGADDFRILEDGRPQEIRRFETVDEVPLAALIVMDTSASMASSLAGAQQAALRFVSSVVGREDRAGVITFNRLPRVAAPLTSDQRILASSLIGLTAEGETALYDSLMYSLYHLAGVTGQRALLLLTDGRDEVSEFGFTETLDFAKRSGIAIFSVGLSGSAGAGPERARLRALSSETGGRSVIVDDISELEAVYSEIESDLRSRYLLAYQSNSLREDSGFRRVEVRVPKAAEVRTMSGYYP